MMLRQTHKATVEDLELLGDLHPLVDQLGTADGLVTLAGASNSLQMSEIMDLSSLSVFLRGYHEKILLPIELPAIKSAFENASRNELRELVALDRALSEEPMLRNFAAASRRVGQGQLQKLRPLRDQRLVQRYLASVDARESQGWHTLVYGVTLAVYSLPLRQGLFGYARQTTRGFVNSAAVSLRLSDAEARALFEESFASLPASIEVLLSPKLLA